MTELHKLECVAWQYIRWGLIVEELAVEGYTNAMVSRALNVTPQTVQWWKRGAEPRYSRGEALLLLHSKVFGRESTVNLIRRHREMALMLAEPPANAQGANHARSATQASRSTR